MFLAIGISKIKPERNLKLLFYIIRIPRQVTSKFCAVVKDALTMNDARLTLDDAHLCVLKTAALYLAKHLEQ